VIEDSNMVLIPMAVTRDFFAVLNRAASKRGITAGELFAEKMREIALELLRLESQGSDEK